MSFANADFWLDGWNFREQITFSYAVNSGVQVNFNVTFSDLNYGCQGDFDDLRFYTKSGEIMLAYNESTVFEDYIEVWVVSDGSSDCWIFYGNDAVGDYWNITAVFNTVIENAIISNPMLEGVGSTTYDYSGHGTDGTLYNCDWVNDSPFGETSIHINMSSSQIVYDYDSSYLEMNETFTFFYWIYFDDFELNNGWGFVHPGVGGWYNYLSANPNQNIRTYFLDNVTYRLTLTGDIYENEWVFYSARYNISDKMSSFRNGEPSYYNVSTTSYPHNSTNQILWSGNNALNATVCLTFLTSDYITDEQEVILYNSYPDMQILNGSCCARTWVAVMPDIIFGDLTEIEAMIFFFGFIAFVIAISALGLAVSKKKH